MAEHYVSDDEQMEAIKRWWKDNGTGIIVGISLGLAGVLGWQYWTSYRAGQAEDASLQYDVMTAALQENDIPKAREQAQKLLEDYDNTAYAVLASLMLAKLAVDRDDNKAAAEHLEWVLDNADRDELKDITRLRLARILLAEERYDDAEAQLEQIENRNFIAEAEELRGDIYLARDDLAQARSAYEVARAAAGLTRGSSTLQLKLDNLPPVDAAQGQ